MPASSLPCRGSSRWRSRSPPPSARTGSCCSRGRRRTGRCPPATTLTSSAGTPSSSATSCAYRASLPSDSVVRLSTILPVGCTRRNTARYASLATAEPPRLGLHSAAPRRARQSLALLVGGQSVVLLEVAEARLRPAERVRRAPRAARTRDRCRSSARRRSIVPPSDHPGVVPPRSARGRWASPQSCPGRASRWPTAPPRSRAWSATSTAAAELGGRARAPIAAATSSSASKLWPLTSASQYGSAATMPPAAPRTPGR